MATEKQAIKFHTVVPSSSAAFGAALLHDSARLAWGFSGTGGEALFSSYPTRCGVGDGA